jgi:signal transduction histidine kinase
MSHLNTSGSIDPNVRAAAAPVVGRPAELVSRPRAKLISAARRRRAAAVRATFGRVNRLSTFLARHPRLGRSGDAALAVALLVASLADLLHGGRGSGWGGPRILEVLVALATSLPFLRRRTHPVPVLAIVMVASVVGIALVHPRQAAFEPFLALVLAFYGLGAHDERIAPFAAALTAGLGSGLVLVVVGWSTAGNGLPTAVWAASAWVVGRMIRSWRSRAAELERANRVLQEQRELQARAAVTVERGRIARELHDVIAHNVSMIVVQAGAASRVLEGAQPDVRAALAAIEQTGRETVDEMRSLLGVLRRADDGLALAPQPGLDALDALVAQVREAGLPVELAIEGTPSALPPGIDLSAYRIAQEALTNALKHAGDARASVTVRYSAESVELEIRDDGAGTGAGGGTGHGLIGMRERVALWGGKLHVGRERGGWVVHATLPVRAEA